MFSERDFERLWFLYKTEGKLKSMRGFLANIYLCPSCSM